MQEPCIALHCKVYIYEGFTDWCFIIIYRPIFEWFPWIMLDIFYLSDVTRLSEEYDSISGSEQGRDKNIADYWGKLVDKSLLIHTRITHTFCTDRGLASQWLKLRNIFYENHDIASAMSPSRADPVLGLNILLHCLWLFKYLNILNQCHWPGWEYLYI